MKNTKNLQIAYFGGEPIGVPALEELKAAGIIPNLIITNPDRPVGRKQTLTPPPTKVWAQEHNIQTFQPESWKDVDVRAEIEKTDWDLFIVVAYSKILPEWLIDLPKHKTLNVHPSLLPQYRGASPIRSAILDNNHETGVTIMQMDAEMDHGAIVGQMMIDIAPEHWPMLGRELDEALARMGGSLLAAAIPEWIAGNIDPQDQDHSTATFCTKITREMGELELNPHKLPTGNRAYQMYLKYCAFDGWPGTYFVYKGVRVKINEATHTKNTFTPTSVTPAGKKQMSFEQYLAKINNNVK